MRLLAYGLLAFQVVQAVVERRTLSAYMESYWLVTYDHGFVRRGLNGAILVPFGIDSSPSIAGAAWILAGLAVVAVVVLMELLFRARTARSAALGILLGCTPFLVDYTVYQRRPDLVGLPLLVGLGLVLLYARRRLVLWCGLIGLLFAISVFVHEATATYALPWALVMIAVMAPRLPAPTLRTRVAGLLALIIVPAFVALVVVATFGQASRTTVNQLRADATSLEIGTRPNGTPRATAFDFLSDDVSKALDRVQEIPKAVKVGDFAFGGFIVGIQLVWLWWWVKPRIWRQLLAAGPAIATVAVLAVLGGTAVLFATGIDWLRWVALIGGAGLIACGFALLAEDEPIAEDGPTPAPDRTDRVQVHTVLPFVAIYLAAMAPIIQGVQLSHAARILLLRE